jgi:hypothetical protein
MRYLITITIIVSSIISISFVMRDDGIAGRTGSPGETTCNTSNCHVGNIVNAAGGSISINAPTMTNWEYVPGQTYPIEVTITRTGINLYGIGFEALQASGANGGTLSVTTPSQTTLKSAVVLGNVRTNVVHQLNGGASAGSKTFTFNWTAPLTNIGNVTFYTAGNAANGNGSTSGDFIYTAEQMITPSTVGIQESDQFLSSISIYPNPANRYVSLKFVMAEPAEAGISLFDINGKQIDKISNDFFKQGLNEVSYFFSEKINPGLYFVKISTAEGEVMKKVVVM